MHLATSRSRLLVTSLELVTEESVHNTSLPVRKQLVLKLEIWIRLLELLQRLPGGVSIRMALSLNEKIPRCARRSCAQNSSRCRNGPAMDDGRKRHHRGRRVSSVLLEEHHVEHVMQAGLGR